MRYTPAGKAVCELGIAVDTGWGENKSTAWVSVTFWEAKAELVGKYVHKGSRVGIVGRLKEDSWDDKETGKKRTKLAVVCTDLVLLDSKPERGEEPQRPSPEPASQMDESEVPF